MTPKTKIAFRAVLGCFGLFVAFSAFYFGHWFIAIFLVVVTTFFASSSKFAKEVNNIQLWKKVTGGRYNDYPQTKEQLAAASDTLRMEFFLFMQDFLDVKDKYDAGKRKYNGGHLGLRLESEMANCQETIVNFWHLLEYFGLLPLHPTNRCPWEGWEPFVENAYSHPYTFNDMFHVDPVDQVFA